MQEIWREYKRNNVNVWEVSNYGNVKKNGKLHTPYQNDVYLRCGCFKIHIAVAELFIGPKPGPEYQVDHIDTNRHNNNVNNLRWVTPKENQNNTLTRQHLCESAKGKHTGEKNPMYGKGHLLEGEKNGRAKKCIFDGKTFGCIKDARNYAKSIGVSESKFREMLEIIYN